MDKGKIGESLVSQFFDSRLSKFFSFPNPKTKSNQEVADVLVWWNRVAFLIEVKTRIGNSNKTISWISSKIKEATNQIITNYKRIRNNEVINLFNSYYHTKFDCEGLMESIGIVVLVNDDNSNIVYPKQAFPEIYNQEIPIHIFSWNDLERMTSEIDTVPDFKYYLMDRIEYLKSFDIPVGFELNVLGLYKMNLNKFPKDETDFVSIPYWNLYQETMSTQIKIRELHNQNSGWVDVLESQFHDQRKLFDGYPLGLYFAWEIGSISRRERAYMGEMFSKVQAHFDLGNETRIFSLLNQSTGNWLLFYYSIEDETLLNQTLLKLVKLKLIKEVHEENFNQGVYAFGFQVSKTLPPKLLGLVGCIVMTANEVKGKYTRKDIEESSNYFVRRNDRKSFDIEEFPQ